MIRIVLHYVILSGLIFFTQNILCAARKSPPEDWQLIGAAKKNARMILSRSPEHPDSILEELDNLDKHMLALTRQQFQLATKNSSACRFIEPYVMRKMDPHAVLMYVFDRAVTASGDEKIYLKKVFSYMLGPDYKKPALVTNDFLNRLLIAVAEKETHLPSLMPSLLHKGAHPYAQVWVVRERFFPALFTVTRLNRASKEEIELVSKHLVLMLSHAKIAKKIFTDEDQAHAKKIIHTILGETAKHKFTTGDYHLHWKVWIDLCALLGADIVCLRKSIFPFLKGKGITESDYNAIKLIQSNIRNDFDRFVLSCVIHEFLYCLTGSMQASDVYNLQAYTSEGKMEKCIDNIAWHAHNARQFCSELKPEAQDLRLNMLS